MKTVAMEHLVINAIIEHPAWTYEVEALNLRLFPNTQTRYLRVLKEVKPDSEDPLVQVMDNEYQESRVYSLASFESVIKELSELTAVQRMVTQLESIVSDSEAMTAKELRSQIMGVTNDESVIKTYTWTDMADSAFQEASHKDVAPPVDVLIPKLQEYMGGINRRALVVIGGRPGAFKTAYGWQICYEHARTTGETVGVLSLEMSHGELGMRAMAGMGSFSGKVFEVGDETAREKAMAVYRENSKLPIVCAEEQMTIYDIEHTINMWIKKYDVKLVMIDYIQMINTIGKFNERRLEIGNFAKTLKALAKRTQVPIIALAQLGREVDERKTPPVLSDLSESKEIEAYADTVLLMWRKKFKDGNRTVDMQEIILAKQRNGPAGKMIHVVFDGPTYTVKQNFSAYDTDL